MQAAIVGTAYDPRADDEALKKNWLASHPDYEDAGKRKGVQRKVIVTKVLPQRKKEKRIEVPGMQEGPDG